MLRRELRLLLLRLLLRGLPLLLLQQQELLVLALLELQQNARLLLVRGLAGEARG